MKDYKTERIVSLQLATLMIILMLQIEGYAKIIYGLAGIMMMVFFLFEHFKS